MLQGLQGPPTPPPPGLDWTFLLDQAMPIVVMIVLFIGLRWVLQTPVGEALAERIRTKMRGRPGGIGEDPHRVTALEDQVAQLHGQVAELAERLDFAERMLAERRERKLGGGAGRWRPASTARVLMGIFDRLSTLFRSNINDLISRAENPEKMLNQLIVDMRGQLAKAKQQVAAAIADEKRLSSQVDQEKKSAEDWERRAVLAVQEGRDDLAKQALLRHNEHGQGAGEAHGTWVKHREETEKLKLSLRQLNDRIEDAKRKKNILIARQKRAEAHKRIQETMSSIGDKSVFETFEC